MLLTHDGRLTIGVLWSAWLPPAGAAASMMESLAHGLRDDGWVSLQRPGAAAATARVMSSPGRPAEAPVAWCALPATAVTIGIDAREGARLAEALVEIERRGREAEGSLGFDGFDREQRRQEIVAGLELAVGASREAVAAGEIMRPRAGSAAAQQSIEQRRARRQPQRLLGRLQRGLQRQRPVPLLARALVIAGEAGLVAADQRQQRAVVRGLRVPGRQLPGRDLGLGPPRQRDQCAQMTYLDGFAIDDLLTA